MAMGEYYGRVDYTCPKYNGKNLFKSVFELILLIAEKIITKPAKKSAVKANV